MRRWIAALVLVVVPLLNGCCCRYGGCGYRLFCRPCMCGPCADCCGGCAGAPVGGCASCYGMGGPMTGAPMMASPAPPPAGPIMTNPPIEKISSNNSGVPTRVMR